MPENNDVAQPKQDSVYEAQVVIEQFVANSAFREMMHQVDVRNAVQYLAGAVAGCVDVDTHNQSVRISIVSDNGAVDFRYTLRKPGPVIVQASPQILAKLDKEVR